MGYHEVGVASNETDFYFSFQRAGTIYNFKVMGYQQPKGAWFTRQLFLSKLLLLVSRV